jgi:hypothetical protein
MPYGILHIPTGNLVYSEFHCDLQHKLFRDEYKAWLHNDKQSDKSEEDREGLVSMDLYGFFLGTDLSTEVGTPFFFLVALENKKFLNRIIHLRDFREQLGLDLNPGMEWDQLSHALTQNPQLLPDVSEFEVVELPKDTATMQDNYRLMWKEVEELNTESA